MRPVSLCIVNFNGAEHLPRTLAAVREQDWSFAEVLVIDNGSTDGSADLATSLMPCTVVRLHSNRGPGAARNAALAAARCDLILFVDNDVRLLANTAARLLDDLDRHPDAVAVAPRVLYGAEPERIQFDSADCHFLGMMTTRNAECMAADGTAGGSYTTSLVTACFLIDRARWRGAPLFDETLGFNLEDHDFGVRACVAGHRLRCQPDARVLHGSGTPGLSYRPGVQPGAERLFYLTRNRWIVITRCFAPSTLFVLAPALVAFELLQFAWLLSRRRPGVWFRAAASWSRRLPGLLDERRGIQQSRRTPDGSILRDAPLPVTRHVRGGGLTTWILHVCDSLLRGYWRWAQRWIPREG